MLLSLVVTLIGLKRVWTPSLTAFCCLWTWIKIGDNWQIEQGLILEMSTIVTSVFFCIAAHYIFNLSYHTKTGDVWVFIQVQSWNVSLECQNDSNRSIHIRRTEINLCAYTSCYRTSIASKILTSWNSIHVRVKVSHLPWEMASYLVRPWETLASSQGLPRLLCRTLVRISG